MLITENYLFTQNYFYKLKKEETLKTIIKEQPVTENILKVMNNIESASFGDRVFIPSLDGVIYTVKPMENMQVIAKKFRISVDEIIKINCVSSTYAGQKLYIPKLSK